MAVANYHDEQGSLPPAYIADASGKPMHSWRVLLLPYMEEQRLYDQYDFDEPWNGPNNRQLADRIPHVYRCPCEPEEGTTTNYVVVTGEGTAFSGDRSLQYSDIGDGSSNTIFIIEIADSDIHWMEPRDLPFDEMGFEINSGRPGISSAHIGGAMVAMGDGSTKFLSNEVSPSVVRSQLTANGNEPPSLSTPRKP